MSGTFFLTICSLFCLSFASNAQTGLEVVWDYSGAQKLLGTVELSDLAPARGRTLEDLVEKSIQGLSIEDQSTIDLVLLVDRSGKKIEVPRAFVNRFPIWVHAPGKKSPRVAVPVSRFPEIEEQVLPWQRYNVEDLRKLILTNYRKHYQPEVFLRSRRDPSAIRGEKRFVQACMGCHGGPSFSKITAAAGGSVDKLLGFHSKVEGMPQFSDLDKRSITKYIKLIQDGNKLAGSSVVSQQSSNFLFQPARADSQPQTSNSIGRTPTSRRD